MNKHFEDTRYYLKRAGETAKQGIQEEVEPLQERVQGIIGEEEEPEPTRVEKLRADLKEVSDRAEGEAKEAIEQAREKVTQYRDERNT